MQKMILFGLLFNGLRISVGAFSILYLLENGMSITEVGILKSFQAIVILLTDMPISYFADQKSRKISLILAAIFSAIWLLIMGFASDFSMFLLAEFCNALSIAFFSGIMTSLLVEHADSSNQTNQKILSQYSKWNHFGMFAFSMIGAFLYDLIGLYVWFLASIFMLLTACFGGLSLPAAKSKTFSHKISIMENIRLGLGILKNNQFLSICFVASFMTFHLIAQFWQVMYQNHHFLMSKSELGIVFSLILIAQMIAALCVEKYSAKYVIIWAFMLNIFLIIGLFANVHDYKYGAILLSFLPFFILQILLILTEAELHASLINQLRASYFSFLQTAAALLLFLTYPLCGYLIGIFGYKIMGVFMLLVQLFLMRNMVIKRF